MEEVPNHNAHKTNKAKTDRENTVLMAIYTDPSDIPATPKSPPPAAHAQTDGGAGQGQGQGQGIAFPATDAKLREVQTRWNEERAYGANWAVWNALQRLGGGGQPAAAAAGGLGLGLGAGTTTSFTGARGGEVVQLLTSDAVQRGRATLDLQQLQTKTLHRWQDYADAAAQKAVLALESVFVPLRGAAFPATEPPAYITDPERVKEWWTGYNREKQRRRAQAEAAAAQPAAAAGPGQDAVPGQDAASAWAAYYAQFLPQQQQQQQPSMDADAQLQALLATLGGGGGGVQPAAAAQDAQLQALLANMSGAAGAGDASAYMLMLAQWAAGQQQQQDQAGAGSGRAETGHGGHGGHNGRNNDHAGSGRGRAGGSSQTHREPHRPGTGPGGSNTTNNSTTATTTGRGRRDRDTQEPVPSHLRGINRALIGTKACVFWASGKCAKGDKCTFRHDY